MMDPRSRILYLLTGRVRVRVSEERSGARGEIREVIQ